MKRLVQDVLDHSPRLQALTPPKTREVVQWCRQRGYTPPDPEPQRKNDDESIEDILTQIDNEPGEFLCAFRYVTATGASFTSAWFCDFTVDSFLFSAAQNESIFCLQCSRLCRVWV